MAFVSVSGEQWEVDQTHRPLLVKCERIGVFGTRLRWADGWSSRQRPSFIQFRGSGPASPGQRTRGVHRVEADVSIFFSVLPQFKSSGIHPVVLDQLLHCRLLLLPPLLPCPAPQTSSGP